MRALLVDVHREEILLIKALVPDTGNLLWFTPGGGKENDESDLDCLAREVCEETGYGQLLDPAQQVQLVWTRSEQFVFMGDDYHQDERYFWVPVERFEVQQQALEAHEQDTFVAARWWSLDAITVSDEVFVPADLGAQVRHLLEAHRSGRLPRNVLHVGR